MTARLVVLTLGLALAGHAANCTYSLSGIVSYAGGANNGSVTVTATPNDPACSWTASSPVNWITITSGSPGTGTGTVQFSIQANPATSARSATLTVASQSYTITQAGQTKAVTTTTLNASPSTPSQGQTVLLTATVTPSAATGTVTFSDQYSPIATVTISSGTAALATSTLAVGTHSLSATYNGDSSFATSTSSSVSLTVGNSRTATVTGFATIPNPSVVGQTVTLNAVVVPASATGTVTFKEGNATLGSGTLLNGSASMTISNLAAGNHSLTASYAGDANYGASVSDAVTQVVNNGTATSLAISPNPAGAGQNVTMTATVAPSAATGSVTFRDGAAVLGSATLANGSASYSSAALAAGSHVITAAYGGDSTYTASTSSSVTLVVNTLTASTVTLVAAPNPATSGQTVTLTATVTPSAATGTVTFQDGVLPLSTVSVSNGTAIFATSTFITGSHSLTASYSGDGSRSASTSNVAALVVNAGGTTTSTILTAAPNPATVGQTVTLTATVAPSTATGTVTFKDAATTLTTVNLTNGSASFAIAALTEGTHPLSALYSGDVTYTASSSNVVSQTILSAAATTTTLAAAPNPGTAGQPVTLTATVAPAGATGNITFKDGVLVLNTTGLSNGTATFVTSALTEGVHSLTAFYAGDPTHTTSTSATVTETVYAAPATTVTLAAAPNPATVGQAVLLTATVAPSTSTGTVTFKDGSATLATAALANGTATLSVSNLTAGIHSLTATFGGVTSAPVSEGINQATATSTGLAASPNPGAAGQPVTLTATVTPSTATGTITFKDGAVTLSTVTLVNGAATLVTSTLTEGTHPVSAAYSGDANYAPSNSAVVSEVITGTLSTTVLTVSPNPATVGQTVTLTATVTPSTATGNILFKDGSTVLSTVALSGGSAALTTSSLTAGSHSLTASYGGDATRSASVSAPVVALINPQTATAIALSASPNPAAPGATVTLTATVTPSDATGTVTFKDSNTTLATFPLTNGSISLLTNSLAAGTHSLAVQYSGDSTHTAATSAVVTEVINSSATATITTLSAAPNPANPGDAVTLTATVAPPAATGTVAFKDGLTTLSTVTLSNGAATLVASSLSAGSHSLTASYSGDATRAASTSAAVTQVINQGGTVTTTALAATPNPASAGQTVTLTATVTPSDATGTITFKEGGNTLSAVTLAGGAASVQTSALSPGNHTITASYGGDATHASSASIPVVEVVNTGTATTTSLAVAPNPVAAGQPVTLTATVTPSSATGTVTFKDGATTLNTATLANGSATLATSTLTAGTHSLTAVYGGSATMSPGTSTAVTLTVNVPKATITLAVSPNPADFGQLVTLTVGVVPSTAAGTLIISDSDTGDLLGPVTLAQGTAKFTTSSLRVGSHTFQATYSGDANNASSQSATVAMTVNAVATTTVLTASPASAGPADTVTLTATVTPSAATGTVTFKDGSTTLGTATAANWVATYTTATLTAGKHSITASYGGDRQYAASVSSAVTVSIALPSSTTTVTVSPATSSFGQTVTITATVSPATATGTVNILDGSAALGSAALKSGVAVYSTSALTIGSHSLSAVYTGDANYATSTSAAVTAAVNKPASTVLLSVAPSSPKAGQSVIFTATVSPSTATGAIAFLDGQSVIGTATLSSGTATYQTTTLAAGTHSVTASYGGDSKTASSQSAAVTVTVAPGTPVNISSLTDPPLAFIGLAWSQTFQATGGTPPYKWSMPAGGGLTMKSSGDTATISGTPQAAGSSDVSLRVQDAAGQAATADFSLDVYPLPSIRITATQPGSPADQPAPQLTLDQPYPFPLTGTLSLAFVPAVGGLPAGYNLAQFSNGATSFPVNIPANSTLPSPGVPPIQLGTVAGDITGTLGAVSIAGIGQALPFAAGAPNVRITLPKLAPIIVPGSVRIVNVTASGFQVFLDATSTPRDLVRGTFAFTAAPGMTMNGCSPNCTVSFGDDAAKWFAAADGVANGGMLSLTVPFAFSGDTGVIDKVTVTLTNSAGTSAPVSGGR